MFPAPAHQFSPSSSAAHHIYQSWGFIYKTVRRKVAYVQNTGSPTLISLYKSQLPWMWRLWPLSSLSDPLNTRTWRLEFSCHHFDIKTLRSLQWKTCDINFYDFSFELNTFLVLTKMCLWYQASTVSLNVCVFLDLSVPDYNQNFATFIVLLGLFVFKQHLTF